MSPLPSLYNVRRLYGSEFCPCILICGYKRSGKIKSRNGKIKMVRSNKIYNVVKCTDTPSVLADTYRSLHFGYASPIQNHEPTGQCGGGKAAHHMNITLLFKAKFFLPQNRFLILGEMSRSLGQRGSNCTAAPPRKSLQMPKH